MVAFFQNNSIQLIFSTMKKLFLSLLFALPFVLSAQVSTIQVSVSDTIEVAANHIAVSISFGNSDYPVMPYNEETETTDTDYIPPVVDYTADRALVIKLLDENKVSWKPAADQLGFLGALSKMGGGGDTLSISADFSSLEQMNKVMPGIKAVKSAKTVESGASVDKEKVDLTRLYDKLLKKARAKAETLARLSGKKVGAVYQIGSMFDSFNPEKYMESLSSGSSPYSGLMKMMGGMFSEKRPDYKVPVSENMSVAYYLID